MNGFERRKQRKKNNIINAAYELFSSYGVQKVSIQEIAQKAQVSQVTIYNYFGGKDQLLLETVKTYAEESFKQFKAVIEDSERSFKEKIAAVITNKQEGLIKIKPEFLQAIMSDQPQIEAFVQEYTHNKVMPLFMKLIEEGKQEGGIHPDLSFQAVMFYVDMYAQAMRKHPEIYESEESLKGFTAEVTHLFFYGLIGNQDADIHQ